MESSHGDDYYTCKLPSIMYSLNYTLGADLVRTPIILIRLCPQGEDPKNL